MVTAGRIVLYVAAFLVATGGFYDLLMAGLPPNLAAACGEQESSRRVVRALLRALGGALASIGIATAVLVAHMGTQPDPFTLALVLVLIVPSELINALGMRRVGSPFYVPLAFVLLAVVGVLLCQPAH